MTRYVKQTDPRSENDIMLPRKHDAFLRTLTQTAQQHAGAERDAAIAASDIPERLAAQLETLWPSEDLAVLERYGHAETVHEADVAVHVAERPAWRRHFSPRWRIALPRPVLVRSGRNGLSAGFTRYSQVSGWGLTETGRAEMTDETFEAFKADHLRRERTYVAKDIEARLVKAVEAALALETLCVDARSFHARFCDDPANAGRKPRWRDCLDAAPALRPHFNALIKEPA